MVINIEEVDDPVVQIGSLADLGFMLKKIASLSRTLVARLSFLAGYADIHEPEDLGDVSAVAICRDLVE